MTATATTPPTTSAGPITPARKPIFAKPIPVIGVTGDFESGKTRFILSLAPGPDTCIFDTEKSSDAYDEIGFKRISMADEMIKLPQYRSGYKPIDTFQFFNSAVKRVPPGRFRVIGLDVAEDIEAGLADWVWENPDFFNHTRNQYLKASGIFWGDVKELWKQLLLDITSRCEIFAFAVHTGSVWGSDNKPTGVKRPKGKSTLMELATLFLHLERIPLADGSKPEAPAAKVLKSRLSHNKIDADGNLVTKAILPPRIPVCTVQSIRAYIAKPADYTHLTADEKAPERMMSDDERAQLRLATATAEAEAARLQIELSDRSRAGVRTAPIATAEVFTPAEQTEPEPEPTEPVNTQDDDDGETLQDALVHHAPTPQSQSPMAVQVTTPEPTNEPTTEAAGTDATTGHEAPFSSTQTQAPAQPAEYVRPASLAPTPQASIRALWDEFAHLQSLTEEQKNGAFANALAKFNAKSMRELSDADAYVLERVLVTNIRKIYSDRGMSNACPF
jgi:hypothetical protein